MTIECRDGVPGKACINPECATWKPTTEFNRLWANGAPRGDGFKSRYKACINAAAQAKYAANPEAHRQKARAYVEANRAKVRSWKRRHQQLYPERYAASLKAFRETHRATINAQARERRNMNIEHYREIGRKSLAKHREKRNAASRSYARKHRAWSSAKVRARRALKYQAEGSHTEAQWEVLKTQYDWTCLRCGKREPAITLTRDHVVPLTQGGSDWIDNIQPLCFSCNSSKNARTIDYRASWEASSTTSIDHEDR